MCNDSIVKENKKTSETSSNVIVGSAAMLIFAIIAFIISIAKGGLGLFGNTDFTYEMLLKKSIWVFVAIFAVEMSCLIRFVWFLINQYEKQNCDIKKINMWKDAILVFTTLAVACIVVCLVSFIKLSYTYDLWDKLDVLQIANHATLILCVCCVISNILLIVANANSKEQKEKSTEQSEENPTAHDSKFLWGRIGMSIPCTDEEYVKFENLLTEDKSEAAHFLIKLIKEKAFYNGESYLPADADDNPNGEDFDFEM